MSRLPQFGDNSKLKLTPANPAGFAHIGAEIKMKDGPHVSNVAGSLFSSDTIVRIQSAFTEEQIRAARNLVLDVPGEKEREAFEICAEKIPLIGRLIAHDTGIVFFSPCISSNLTPLYLNSALLGSARSHCHWRVQVA